MMRFVFIAVLVASAGCEFEVEEETLASSSVNALSENRLSYNRLSYNRLSYNRLSYNSLDNDIQNSADGREILFYIARCALAEGDTLVVTTKKSGTFEYPGLLGLAAKWEERALDLSEQRRVSACLMAHVNAYGVAVPVSLRYPYWLPSSADETARFDRFEGAFFGNLFDPNGSKLYSCHADDVPNLSDPARLDPAYGDRLLRRCTDGECGAIVNLGPCSKMCLAWPGAGYTMCVLPDSEPMSIEGFYLSMVNVFLLKPDDECAVWPSLLEPMFGPQLGPLPVEPKATTATTTTTTTGSKGSKRK